MEVDVMVPKGGPCSEDQRGGNHFHLNDTLQGNHLAFAPNYAKP